jgi:hypothetical protein
MFHKLCLAEKGLILTAINAFGTVPRWKGFDLGFQASLMYSSGPNQLFTPPVFYFGPFVQVSRSLFAAPPPSASELIADPPQIQPLSAVSFDPPLFLGHFLINLSSSKCSSFYSEHELLPLE